MLKANGESTTTKSAPQLDKQFPILHIINKKKKQLKLEEEER